MVKKRKVGRSVRNNKNVNQEPTEFVNAPHSFVIHKGQSGGFIVDITRDFRKVMEPFTASSLKERKNNSVKDFVHVAGLLHVSHLCIFSQTTLGVYLKLGKIPRGPTLTFKVENFILARDVISSLKKQLVVEEAFKHSPLIVLNNFSGEEMQMKLMASMFQNMFPTLNLQKVDLNTVRRVVLINYNSDSKLIDFRHYAIKMQPVGVSKGVKKMVTGKVPNLAKCEDIADFFNKTGILSESEAEDDPNAHVTLPENVSSKAPSNVGKSAIKLSELGPRLTLHLIKIEDGLMDGEVLFHDLIEKTQEEKNVIRKLREKKKKLKEKRKKAQDLNVKAKEEKKQELKEKSLKGMQKPEAEPVEEDDDAQYYREEVGEEPEKELFPAKSPSAFKRPATSFQKFKSKKPRLEKNDSKHGKKVFGNRKFKGREEKTNAKNRDFRTIGGKNQQSRKKFKK